jgi:serine/threonine-protein kinase HipA
MADEERHLVVLIEGSRAGVVTMSADGHFTLTYDERWRATRDATPLSLSMPLTRSVHDDRPVRAFLWGLLPDSERVLERWAQTYHVSPRNPFALLRHVGEDCAGAAQFVTPERVDVILEGEGGVRWMDEDEVTERLGILRRDPAAWHVHDTGQFSLAGAQAKTALYYDPERSRWGEPWGAVPTTHILKPAVVGLDDHDLNEHLCLRAAGVLGLPVASSRIVSFGPERVVVVERYDRRRTPNGDVTRIHQEDMCQALGVPPMAKYQNESGPTPEQIIELLRSRSDGEADRDVGRFVDALAFNWIIGGTDAHAKNYSLLLAGPQVRLAALYDIASALVYDGMYLPRLKMAMKIGGEYGVERVAGRHWRRFAVANGLAVEPMLARLDHLAAAAPDAFASAAKTDTVDGLASTLPGRLVAAVTARAARCREALWQ